MHLEYEHLPSYCYQYRLCYYSRTTLIMASHIKSEEPQVIPASSQSSLSAIEKGNVATTDTVDLDHVGETKGYVLDEETLKDQLQLAPDAILKKSKNGKVVLIPQPTDDPQVRYYTKKCSVMAFW